MDTPFLTWFRNTVLVATVSTAISVVVAALAAYALARLRFLGAGLLTTVLLITYLLPGSLLFIPLYRILTGRVSDDELIVVVENEEFAAGVPAIGDDPAAAKPKIVKAKP